MQYRATNQQSQDGAAERLHAEADALVRAMYAGRVGWAARERAVALKVRASCATLRDEPEALAAPQRLLYLRAGTPALRVATVEPVLPALGPRPGNTSVDALLHFARFRRHWLRPPEAWSFSDADTEVRARIGSLARHLFARYPLPAFLDAAWLSGRSEEAEEHRLWFAHLGGGGRLEALHFPLPMTHRAAHHFLLAPGDFSIVGAMRFGQVRALGGADDLARALAGTFLSDGVQSDESFWLSVVHFLVNHPHVPLSEVGPVSDYLRWRKFGADGDGGSEPSLSMKGRTPHALLRAVSEWHEELARRGAGEHRYWEPGGIASPESCEEPDPLAQGMCRWSVVEITDSVGLLEEGRAMRHCVRTYQHGCLRGTTSIWSLRLSLASDPTARRLLTIEVNNRRRAVVQVRGRCNQTLPGMAGNKRMMLARDFLREWARRQDLTVACPL